MRVRAGSLSWSTGGGAEREGRQSGGVGCSRFCGQILPSILICCNQWYYVAGCDTYLLPANLLHAIEGLDFQQRIVVGGHAGMHFDTLFLSGGSGLVFSQVKQVCARARAVCLLAIIPPSLPRSLPPSHSRPTTRHIHAYLKRRD